MINNDFQTYQDEIIQWQQTMENNLRSDDGWLSVVGLDWLEEGMNTIGSAPGNSIVLPEHAPEKLGYIEFSNEQAKLFVETDKPVLVDGVPEKSVTLRDDHSQAGPSLVKIDSITFSVIKRSNQYGIRVRDSKSPAIANFTGRHWFPVDMAYKVSATFVPHETPRSLQIVNSVGMTVPMQNPGRLEFELHGNALSLEAFYVEEDHWWLVFKDATSGSSSYGAGRFLYTKRQSDGQLWIDFNRAYHPPCAFTHHATCPLPPKENILSIPINAGERF